MLYSTQSSAGTNGIKSASPRLSPSAKSASCCAAKAGSAAEREEKIRPAVRAAVVRGGDGLVARPLGEVATGRKENIGFVGLMSTFLVQKYRVLRIVAIDVAMVAAIDGNLSCFLMFEDWRNVNG